MPAELLNGKAMAKEIRAELRDEVTSFVAATGIRPQLAAVLVGEDPASQVYIRSKQRACEQAGIRSELIHLSADASQHEVHDVVQRLNQDEATHGILVQLPLPAHLKTQPILDSVDPMKDVDAFHPLNVGLLSQGRPAFLPCTPHGVLQMLYRAEIPVAGKHVVIVGRSEIVGKPLAMLLSAKQGPFGPDYANGTVTLCHSRTESLDEVTRQGEILIAAIGRPNGITAPMIRPGAVVIDVGINRTPAGLVGDVDFPAAREVASVLTPVPGGVGPLTVAMLLHNTLVAAELSLD